MSPSLLVLNWKKRPMSIAVALGRWLVRPLLAKDEVTSAAQTCLQFASLVLVTCTAIFLIKGFLAFHDLHYIELPPYIYLDDDLPESLGRLWLSCAEDFAVGVGCLFVGLMIARPITARRWRWGLLVLAYSATAFAVAYMVANAQIYHIARRFLNLSLYHLAGGVSPERSVQEHITTSPVVGSAVILGVTRGHRGNLVRHSVKIG